MEREKGSSSSSRVPHLLVAVSHIFENVRCQLESDEGGKTEEIWESGYQRFCSQRERRGRECEC